MDLGSDYYTMSSFSSWGVPGSLEMKPEITAPGGSIYSLKDGGEYQNMSGTSMASPQVAGIAALVAQYIKENGLAQKTGLSVRTLSQSLLMSTARPVVENQGADAQGNTQEGYYSVLQQGAGLANAGAAVSSGSYLLMDPDATDSYADGKIKVELGDDPQRTGEYTFGFTLYNMEDKDTSFTLDADFFTQGTIRVDNDGEVLNFTDTSTAPLAANVTWTVDGTVLKQEIPTDLNGSTSTATVRSRVPTDRRCSIMWLAFVRQSATRTAPILIRTATSPPMMRTSSIARSPAALSPYRQTAMCISRSAQTCLVLTATTPITAARARMWKAMSLPTRSAAAKAWRA